MENQVFTDEELKELSDLIALLDPDKEMLPQTDNAVEEMKTLVLTPTQLSTESSKEEDNK